MTLEEAKSWLRGEQSKVNLIPSSDFETWEVRICQADAAMMQQAYYIVKAHQENLV